MDTDQDETTPAPPVEDVQHAPRPHAGCIFRRGRRRAASSTTRPAAAVRRLPRVPSAPSRRAEEVDREGVGGARSTPRYNLGRPHAVSAHALLPRSRRAASCNRRWARSGSSAASTTASSAPIPKSALRRFQLNLGLPSDGIAGAYTYAAIRNLHHSWVGKDSVPTATVRLGFARAADVLERNAAVPVRHRRVHPRRGLAHVEPGPGHQPRLQDHQRRRALGTAGRVYDARARAAERDGRRGRGAAYPMRKRIR